MKKLIDINSRKAIGIAFVFLGIILFLEKFNFIPEIPIKIISFHGILMLIGILLFLSSQSKLNGIILFSIGLLIYDFSLWPLFLIIAGLYIVFNKNPISNYNKNEGIKISTQNEEGPGTFEDANIFGGGHKTYVINNLKKGEVISIFGGSEIDLRACKIEGDEATIELVSIFGGSTIIIPREWNITNNVVAILGGFSDSRLKGPDLMTTNKTLHIKGVVIIGGGEVKN